jgi:hypothetical protein
VIGTKVGRAKHTRIMPGGALEQSSEDAGGNNDSSNSPTSVFVGDKLNDHRGAFIVDYPMDKGCVVDGCWDYMETIWNVSIYIVSGTCTNII